jgi:hypothetical protein
MSMKRFLILFILIVFVTVSCAGPSKVRWTKPDFCRDKFEKDREECKQSVKLRTYESEGNVVTYREMPEECLREKGYELVAVEVLEEPLTVGEKLLIIAITPVALLMLAVGFIQALAYL